MIMIIQFYYSNCHCYLPLMRRWLGQFISDVHPDVGYGGRGVESEVTARGRGGELRVSGVKSVFDGHEDRDLK